MGPSLACILALAAAIAQFGPSQTGELHLEVTDPAGLPLQSTVQLVSAANQLRENLTTDSAGILIARGLPFGRYQVAVSQHGFAPFLGTVEIRSAAPTVFRVALMVAAVHTEITVRPGETLLDPHQTMTVNRIGAETLAQRTTALPGRSLADLVNTQPGWLLEANGVLHPRGSEYQAQYVLDGLPLLDNRSPAFAPEIDPDDVRAMSVLTGGYPAEYGRKLGGVIEVLTTGSARRGFHGRLVGSVGSFDTRGGDAVVEHAGERGSLSIAAGAAGTGRYLDPPVEENFTNDGTISHGAVRFERDLRDTDRFGTIVRFGEARLIVPNERIQQMAGQRQDRGSRELAAQFSFQHVFSENAIGDVRGLLRDLSARLWSNADAIPIVATQDRGFRELYLKASIAMHRGSHEWKFGGDLNRGTVREQFGFRVTDPQRFDPETPATFDFDDRRPDREHAAFVQDQIRLGDWTVNAGLRWDRYRLLVSESAFSPRLGVAWSWPDRDLVLRASYDRAFQTPAIENLLLASSAASDQLNNSVLRLPVRPSRGDFYEVGLSKRLFQSVRLDVTRFSRTMTNFADDDLLLNTGVSFPVAFRRAEIHGAELKIDVPRWRALSGFLSYAYLRGLGELPITGGLWLGDEGTTLLTAQGRFPVSQDQRHTLRGRVSYQLRPPIWVALAASYGSGLPVEFEGDRDLALDQYGPRIVDRVDLAAGRVRPTVSLDASVGLVIISSGTRELRLNADVRNLANRLNVINFSGLFSGTALAPPRSVGVRLQAAF